MNFSTQGGQGYRQTQMHQTQNGRNNNNLGQGQGQGPHNKQKKDDSDEFMRLADHEIVGCINDIKIPFSQEDLVRPQPAQIQKVFECFAHLLMNITRDTVEPAMREAARDVCGGGGGDSMDLIPADTRNLMGFYASLRKLLEACGVRDFSFSDLTKPTHLRLVKIFSYIINFVRFRESQSEVMDRYFRLFEETQARIEAVYLDNGELAGRLAALRAAQGTQLSSARAKAARVDELKADLFALKKNQERLQADMERAKGSKAALASTLEEVVARTTTTRQEAEKLRPYASQSSAALQASLASLADSLARDRAQAEALEKRARALHGSADAFALAAHDVGPLLTALRAAGADLGAEDAEAVEAARRRDALAERSNNVREVERTEALLHRQLERWVERSEALRKQAAERADSARTRTEEVKRVYREVMGERGERGREVERRRVRIEQTEKKMADLKDTIEAEIHAARDEYAKLDAHIRLYITEMEQGI